MKTYKKIAVIYGSDSSEWEVSCRSGEYTASRLDTSKYDVYEIFARFGHWSLVAVTKKDSMRTTFPEVARPEIDKTDFSLTLAGEKITFDFVYIMQHGRPGENGLLQGYFEMIGMPFSSCNSFVSSIAFDKFACKSYLKDVDFVKCAPDAFIRNGEDVDIFCKKTIEKLGLPVFVKPTDGGSSFGISKVKDASELPAALNFAFTEGDSVIVEKAVTGRELTCAAYIDKGQVMALPVIEIITENEYFDYDAKYNGKSKEVCPAHITEEESAKVRQTTKEIYHRLGCKGIVRADYIMSDDGLYFLEVNTIPGMTGASLVPKMIRAAGLNMTEFLTTIIENS